MTPVPGHEVEDGLDGLRFRPRAWLRFTQVFHSLLTICAGAGLINVVRRDPAPDGVLPVLVAVTVATSVVAVIWLFGVEVGVGPDGIRVHSGFRSLTVAWSEIDRLETRRALVCRHVYVVRRDGRPVRLPRERFLSPIKPGLKQPRSVETALEQYRQSLVRP
jgi:hypothetical protein